MSITPTLSESTQNKNNNNAIQQMSSIIRGTAPVIIYYGDSPPEYEGEMLTYIDTPPKYEEPLSIGSVRNNVSNKEKIIVGILSSKQKQKQQNTEDSLSKRKGMCCYSKESDDSRCCGACYLICPSKSVEEQCNCCPNNFCEFWKSCYIQTTEGSVREKDKCRECECDDCFWTTVCFPCKFSLFFPCFLGSVFNECINKLCGSQRNYLF